jgi:prophage tail gpP-like protein
MASDIEDVRVIIERKTRGLADPVSLARGLVQVITNGGPEFRGWTSIKCRLAMDGFSTIEFESPFDASRRDMRDTFRPFSFFPVRVTVGGEDLFRGFLVDVNPATEANGSTVTVSAYALPAALCDNHEPASALPLQWDKQDLRAIAEAICKPFGLSVEFAANAPVGAKFGKVKLDVEKHPFELLTELAQLRGLVITNTISGAVLFQKSVENGHPIANFKEGEQPLCKFESTFSPQDYHSEVTAFSQARRGRRAAKFTAKNPWLPTPLRPLNITLDKIEKGEAPEATRAALARMFANMASFSISDIPGWRDENGNLFRPNTTVTMIAPSAMVYGATELIIRAVNFEMTPESVTTSLELVLPGAFSAEIPDQLPWDEE